MAILQQLLVMLVILAVVVIVLQRIRRYWSPQKLQRLGMALMIFMLFQDLFDRLYHILLLGEPIARNLPLHICGISVITVALLLIFKHRLLFDFSCYAGVSGAIPAILTPDVAFGMRHPLFWTYFISHYFIIIGVLYAIIAYRMKPSDKSLKNALVMTHLYAFVIFGLNYILDSNYLFLRYKPAAASLIDYMGPWPLYLLGLELCMILSFSCINALFAIRPRNLAASLFCSWQ